MTNGYDPDGGSVEDDLHDYAELPGQEQERLHDRGKESREAGLQGSQQEADEAPAFCPSKSCPAPRRFLE